MNDEFNPTVSIEDFVGDDVNEQRGIETVNVKTGIQVGDVMKASAAPANNPNAARWMFNPFEYIDLANDPATFCIPKLHTIIFNKIENIITRVRQTGASSMTFSPILGQTADSEDNYERIARTAYQQAGDLTDRHADKGVIVIKALMNAPDETADAVNRLIFGDSITCKHDLNYPDSPIPVLPDLLETIDRNLDNARGHEHYVLAAQIVPELRKSISAAMKNARTRIGEAQKRLLDEKNPNRTFSPAEERCYLALGEEIPNQMPYLTKSAAAGQNAGIDASKIEDAITRGVVAGISAVAEHPVEPANGNNGDIGFGSHVTYEGKQGVVVEVKPAGWYDVKFADGENVNVRKDKLATV